MRALSIASTWCGGACSRNASAGVAALLLHALLLATGAFSRERMTPNAGGMNLLQVTMFETPSSQPSAAPAAEPAGAPLQAAPRPLAVHAPRVARAPVFTPKPQPTRETTQPAEPEQREASDDTGSGNGGEGSRAIAGAGHAVAGSAHGEGAGTGMGSTVVLPFGAGMTRPVQVQGEQPTYSRAALAARVEGKVLARCVITAGGEVQGCEILKSLPLLDASVLGSLQHSRFQPVTFQGRPQAIRYVFSYNFKLP